MSGALSTWTAGIVGVLVIGVVDYLSGTELRVFPLYYAPISLIAWHHGKRGAAIVALLSTVSWFVSNYVAGRQFSHAGVWIVNTFMQAASFAIVGVLIATLRGALVRERELGRVDPLTTLLNSRAFYEEAERMLSLCRRKRRPVTVAYIDLDNFKTINDTLGHKAGDELLQNIGELLRTSLRPSDVSARLGGDEFAVLIPETGPEEATAALERLQARLSGIFAGRWDGITSTIGAVTFVDVPADVQQMVHEADMRMYDAKSAGKNRLHLDVLRS